MWRQGFFSLVLLGLLLNLQGCLTSTPGARGNSIPESADLRGDPKTIEEILGAFHRFEHALQRKDLEGVMALYAESYQDRSFTKANLREEWHHALAEYHGFSAIHLVTRVEVHSDSIQPVAFVTCSGVISAVSNATGTRVTLDSWIGEVHYLIHEQGNWRIQGDAWEVRHPTEIQFAGHRHQKVVDRPAGPTGSPLSNF